MIENGGGARLIPGKQNHPDRLSSRLRIYRRPGSEIDPESRRPQLDPDTLESNVKGIYPAGVVVAGKNTNEIFIENGRFHGKQIVDALK